MLINNFISKIHRKVITKQLAQNVKATVIVTGITHTEEKYIRLHYCKHLYCLTCYSLDKQLDLRWLEEYLASIGTDKRQMSTGALAANVS